MIKNLKVGQTITISASPYRKLDPNFPLGEETKQSLIKKLKSLADSIDDMNLSTDIHTVVNMYKRGQKPLNKMLDRIYEYLENDSENLERFKKIVEGHI